MSCLGNVIWLIFGGLWGWLAWMITGGLWCLTIIGIPVGLQCFKLAWLSLAPFGKHLVTTPTTPNLVLNILWLCLSGIWLAVAHIISGLILTITIIGIPFAKQSFKLAQLSLMPFGVRVERD